MEDKTITVTEPKQITADPSVVAFEMYQQLKEIVRQTSQNFLVMGRLLKYMRDQKLYTKLGTGGYDTFTSFLADAELGIRPATAYAFIRIYETYIEKLGFSDIDLEDIPYYKLQLLSTNVEPNTKTEAGEWIEKARTLSSSDFQLEIKERNANFKETTYVPFPHIFRCKVCNKWVITEHDTNICQGH